MLRRTIPYAVLLSALSAGMAIPGVSMAQAQTMKAPSGMEEVEASRKALNAAMVDLKTKQSAERLKPNELIQANQAVLTALQDYGQKLTPFNNGTNPIPVVGGSYTQQLDSMNAWLGLPQSTPMGSDTLTRLNTKLVQASGVVQQSAASEAILVAVAAPPQADVTDTRAEPSAVVPLRTTDYFVVYEPQLSKLGFIATNGKANDRKAAATLADDMRNEFNSTSPNEKNIRKLVTNADKLVKSGLRAAQDNAAAANKNDMVEAPGVLQLFNEMKALADRQPSGPATQIVNGLAGDMWLLGEISKNTSGPRWVMYGYLAEAAKAVRAGDENTANSNLAKAKEVFDSQQKLHREMADASLAVLAETLGRLNTFQQKNAGQRLPTRDDLVAADKKRSKGESDRAIRRTSTGAHNGAESIQEDLKRRVETERKHIAGSRLSLDYVAGFDKYAKTTSAAVSDLMSIWELYTRSNPNAIENKTFMSAYGETAIVFVDHQLNPYDNFAPDVKRAIRRELAHALGRPSITDKEAAQEIMNNTQLKYAEVLGRNLYKFAMKAAPEPTDKIAPAIAKMDSLRIYHMRNYERYGPEFSNPFNAIEVARSYLGDMAAAAEDAVAAGAIPKTVVDPIIDLAKRWNAAYANFPKEAWIRQYNAASPKDKSNMALALRREAADVLAAMATDISSMVKLRILLNNPGYRAASVPDGSPDYRKALAIAETAEKDFAIRYGVPGMPLGLFAPLPGAIANEAVRHISPSAFRATDSYGREAVSTDIDTASVISFALVENAPLDKNNEPQPVKEDELYKALLSDAKDAKEAAYKTELRFVTLVKSLRDVPAFGSTAVQATLATPGGLAPVMAMESPFLAATAERNLTESLPYQTWVVPSDPTFFTGSPSYHEPSTLYPLGSLYVETSRQRIASKEDQWPMVLRQLDTDPAHYGAHYIESLEKRNIPASALAKASTQYAALGTSVQQIMKDAGLPEGKPLLTSIEDASKAALADPALTNEQKLQRLNDLSLALLRVRIAELESRLAGVRVIDGAPVSELAGTREQQSKEPERWTIMAARQWLAAAKKIEQDLSAHHGEDLVKNRVSSRSAIMMTEDAIFTISEDNPRFRKIEWTPTATNAMFVASYKREWVRDGDVKYAKFTAEVNVTEAGSKTPIPLEQYEKKRGSPVPLQYNWIFYEHRSGEEIMVLDPDRRPPPDKEAVYLGKVMRGVLPDGGDAVVKLKPRSERAGVDYSKAENYEVVLKNGKPEVLYALDKGTLHPASLESARAGGAVGIRGRVASIPSGAHVTAEILPLPKE